MQVARLAVADKERVEGARAAAAHAYYSQFTFQPAINPKSKQLVRVSCDQVLEDSVHLQTISRSLPAHVSAFGSVVHGGKPVEHCQLRWQMMFGDPCMLLSSGVPGDCLKCPITV